jgi:hypothetical protein
MVRTQFIAGLTAVALAVLLPACGQQRKQAAATPAELAANGAVISESQASAAAPTPEPTCFVKTDANPAWRPSSTGPREAKCFEQDACNGGIGVRPGLCAKWAIGPDAPALPWSVALTNPQPQNHIPPLPVAETEEADCVKTACPPYGLADDTILYAAAHASAARVATVAVGECVQPGLTRFVHAPPVRGIVLDAYGPFAAGDVIYARGFEADDYTIWWRGAWRVGIFDPLNMAVRWDLLTEADAGKPGHWVEYTRANGQRGWARDPRVSEAPCSVAERGTP